jgi:hypothetical protein
MMTDHQAIKIKGAILARTARTDELELPQWESLIKSIVEYSLISSGVVSIAGNDGSGRTTFLTRLCESARIGSDVIKLAPASPVSASGWLLDAVAPWLTSDHADISAIQKKLARLSGDERPLLVCIDGADFIPVSILASDIAAFLNLCDNCGVRATIVVISSPERSLALTAEKSLSGKILHHQALPSFTPNQILQLLIHKTRDLPVDVMAPKIHDLETIAARSGGSPISACWKLVAFLRLGVTNGHHEDSGRERQLEDQSGKAASRQTKAKTEIKYDLEELLPRPNQKKTR